MRQSWSEDFSSDFLFLDNKSYIKSIHTGAKGTANVFINTVKYNNASIWNTLEAPILHSRGISFRYNFIFP